MNTPFTLVSWYTIDTPYKQIIEDYLLSSAASLMKHEIYERISYKDWKRNTNLKPSVASEALNELNEDILLVDADCKINHYPVLFNEIPQEYDIAFHTLDRNAFFNQDFGPKQYEILSGTLFLRNREIVHKLLDRWSEFCIGSQYPDQKNLELAIAEIPELKIFNLPIEYCWISDLPNGNKPFVERPDKVFIEHYQASRQMRELIKERK